MKLFLSKHLVSENKMIICKEVSILISDREVPENECISVDLVKVILKTKEWVISNSESKMLNISAVAQQFKLRKLIIFLGPYLFQ